MYIHKNIYEFLLILPTFQLLQLQLHFTILPTFEFSANLTLLCRISEILVYFKAPQKIVVLTKRFQTEVQFTRNCSNLFQDVNTSPCQNGHKQFIFGRFSGTQSTLSTCDGFLQEMRFYADEDNTALANNFSILSSHIGSQFLPVVKILNVRTRYPDLRRLE